MTEQPRDTLMQERDESHEAHAAYDFQPAPAQAENSPLALAGFASALAAWFIIPAAGAVAAIILGILAQQQIRRAGGRLKGGDLATAAIVIGGVQIGFIIFAVVGVMLAVPAG